MIQQPTKEEKIRRHITLIQNQHAVWTRAREMQDLANWTTSLVAAQGFWKIVERRFRVNRDAVRDQVNRFVEEGSKVKWNPYHWDLEMMVSRREAEAIRPINHTCQNATRGRRGGHSRNNSMPIFPSTPLSPTRQRLNQLIYQQAKEASRNREHAKTMAWHQHQEEQELARLNNQRQ